MTTPDTVGGLLPCPGCGKSDLDHCPGDFIAVNGLTRGMMVRCAWCHFAAPEAAWQRRELCRAATAGSGEVEEIAKELVRLAKVTREVPGPHAEARGTYSTIKTLETAAALLRKLQQVEK